MNLIAPLAGGQAAFEVSPLAAQPGIFTCVTGQVVPRPAIGIPFAGTHLLRSLTTGRIVASLRSDRLNLDLLSGRVVTICGVSQGEVEGLPVLNVVLAQPALLPLFPFGIPLQPFSPFFPWVGFGFQQPAFGLTPSIGLL